MGSKISACRSFLTQFIPLHVTFKKSVAYDALLASSTQNTHYHAINEHYGDYHSIELRIEHTIEAMPCLFFYCYNNDDLDLTI
jgi:hypothetical protein